MWSISPELVLPTDLPIPIVEAVLAYISQVVRPRVDDPHEQWLASRIALAQARLLQAAHSVKLGQPPDARWLRLEAQADRQLTAARRELDDYRQLNPPPQPLAPIPGRNFETKTSDSMAAPASSDLAKRSRPDPRRLSQREARRRRLQSAQATRRNAPRGKATHPDMPPPAPPKPSQPASPRPGNPSLDSTPGKPDSTRCAAILSGC